MTARQRVSERAGAIRRLVAAATAVAVVVLGAACGAAGSDSDASTLTVGATAEPATLDLTTTSVAAIPQVLLYNVYEPLVKVDAQGKVRPLLASAWTVSPGRKTYRFTLRSGVNFTDGHEFTSADVEYSIKRVLAKSSDHPFKAQLEPVKSVATPDQHTVVVHLKRPSNSWLYDMAGPVGIILDKAAVPDLATKPVGTGPYRFQRWNRGTSISLIRNNSYWGTKPTVENVLFRYFDDPNAMNNAMLSGDLDVISNVQAPQTLSQFDDRSKYTVLDGTTNGEVVLGMNDARGPLKDVRVRRAIMYAISRQQLLKTVWAGKGRLIGSMVPPTDPWYEDLSRTYHYDPKKAKALLAEAGYPDGFTLQMKLPTLPYATGAGQFVAAQLKEVGITCKVSELEFPARWIDTVFTKGDYDLSIVAHVEPRDIVQYGNPQYYWHYDDPKVRQWLAAADRGTPQDQITYMRRVARRITDQAASDWLFLLPNLVVTRKGVSGIPANATTLSFDLSQVKVAAG